MMRAICEEAWGWLVAPYLCWRFRRPLVNLATVWRVHPDDFVLAFATHYPAEWRDFRATAERLGVPVGDDILSKLSDAGIDPRALN